MPSPSSTPCCGRFKWRRPGIDLALALIEEDHGEQVALAVARELVVYLKRPGGQKQYSEPLRFQLQSIDQFADLAAWISAHLRSDLPVRALAARAKLSVRQFSRRFVDEFQITPAAFIEATRLAEGCRRLTSRSRSIKAIASSIGFASADAFRRAFVRQFGIAPSTYRARFGGRASARHAAQQGEPALRGPSARNRDASEVWRRAAPSPTPTVLAPIRFSAEVSNSLRRIGP